MPKRILIIEDNADDAYFMVRALHKQDPSLDVEVCPDPEAALLLLEDPSKPLPRVVFLDLQLGKLTGHEVLKRIRDNPRTRMLPVVVVSGSQMPEDISRSYAIGANSHVRKPNFAAELAEKIGRVAHYWAGLNSVADEELPLSGLGGAPA